MAYTKWEHSKILERVAMFKAERDRLMVGVDNLHSLIYPGTDAKLNGLYYHLSLVPILDCIKCTMCMDACYDMVHDCIKNHVWQARIHNSAIHKADPERYFSEGYTKADFATAIGLRLNVGGDLTDEDFFIVNDMCKKYPKIQTHLFTKNDVGLNKFLEHNESPTNLTLILSRWKGDDIQNPHQVPEAHVVMPDGTTTAPEYGAYYCTNNCSHCLYNTDGCHKLKKGESVVFHAH